jgi:hypothetical protein
MFVFFDGTASLPIARRKPALFQDSDFSGWRGDAEAASRVRPN